MPGNAVIGALRVSLGLDSSQFDTGLKSAQGKLAGFGKAAALGLAGVAVAATAAGVAIAASVRHSLDAFDELGKTSQKIGVSVEALSKLKYAGELADVSMGQLSTGLKKLSVNMLETAKGGSGPAAEAFQALGIKVTDATGKLRAGDAVFADVAERFAHMEDGAQKTAYAVQIFGKAGSDLIPLLNEGKAGLAEMGAEASQLGVVISTETAKAAEEFNDNITRLKVAGEGVTTQLSAGMAPALADVSAAFVDAAKASTGLTIIAQAMGVLIKSLATVLLGLGAALSFTTAGFAALGDVMGKVLKGDFAGAAAAASKRNAEMTASFKGTVGQISTIWTGAGAKVKASAPKVSDELASPIAQGAKKTKAGAKKLKDAVDEAAEAQKYLAGVQADIDRKVLGSDTVQILELQAKARDFLSKSMLNQAAAALRLADALKHLNDNDKAAVDQPGLVNFDVTGADLPKVADFSAAGTDAFAQLFDSLKGVSEGFAGKLETAGNVIYQFSQGFDANSGVGKVVNKIGAAFDHISQAFASGGPIAAAMAAITEAGRAIGGKAGAIIQGFGSGGLVGAALSLFGYNKAKKKAKKEAARRAAEEKAAQEAQVASQHRELEIRLIAASGDAVALRAAQEEDFLKTIAPANKALAEQVLALEKEADAKSAAAEAAASLALLQRGLEGEFLTAADDAAGALKLFREDELAALPEALRPAKQAIYDLVDAGDVLTKAQDDWAAKIAAAGDKVDGAREDLADAYDREKGALEDVRDRFADLADTLADFGRDLRGNGLSSSRSRLAAARADVAGLSGKTDADSLAAIPAAGRALIEASRGGARNAQELARDMATVARLTQAGEAAATAQVSLADQQLIALQKQVDGLITLNDSVLSVHDAIGSLATAMSDQQTAISQSLDALGPLIAGFNAAAATRALNDNAAAVTALPPTAANDAAVAQADQTALLARAVVALNNVSGILDDVTRGGLSLNTVAA